MWWKEAVCYQIYPRSFADSNGDGIGDLNGILGKLDYLQELGVDLLWLNPVYPSPNDDNGYDIADYQGIHPDFGTLADWEALLTAAHQRGMRLIMDLVVNHTSDEHPWFVAARHDRRSPRRDWYIWRRGSAGGPPNNWRACFGGSAWEFDPASGEYYLHYFSRKQPDLNWANPAVAEAIFAMMRWWLDKGIDGFRMDVITALVKPVGLPDLPPGSNWTHLCNQPGMHELLQRMHREVLAPYDVVSVGESPGLTPESAALYVDGRRGELSLAFQFGNVEATQQERWSVALYKKLTRDYYNAVWPQGWLTQFISNHDTPRALSAMGNDSEHRVASAQALALVNLTLPGTPFIYQGDEIGMTNVAWQRIEDYDDILTRGWYAEAVAQGCPPAEALRRVQRLSRDNARTPMQWDDAPQAGFSTGRPWLPVNPNYRHLNLAADRRLSDGVFAFHQQLLRLRKATPALVYGEYVPLDDSPEPVFAFERRLPEDRLFIVANLSDAPQRLQLPSGLAGRHLLLAGAGGAATGGATAVLLPPWAAALYRI